MSWNYRIFKHKHKPETIKMFGHIKGWKPYYYALHEAFYATKKSKEPNSWAEEPEIVAESKAEMVSIVEMMLDDVKKAKVCKRVIQD